MENWRQKRHILFLPVIHKFLANDKIICGEGELVGVNDVTKDVLGVDDVREFHAFEDVVLDRCYKSSFEPHGLNTVQRGGDGGSKFSSSESLCHESKDTLNS